MPVRCVVEKCPSTKSKGCKTHFYKFPLLIESLLRAWIEKINRKDWIPTESSRICELHFKYTDFMNKPGVKRRLLKADIIPLENLFSCVQGEISQQVNLVEKCLVSDSVQEHVEAKTSTTDKNKSVKRKICYVEGPNKRIKELEDEVQHLKRIVESLQEKMTKDLEVQASMFRRFMKVDFFVMMLTLVPCVFLGLEFGILIGIIVNFTALLYFSARPCIQTKIEQIEGETVIVIIPEEAVAFPAAERLRANIMKLSAENECNVILDCKNLKRVDVTVAKNVKLLAKDLTVRGQRIVCSNCCENVNATLRIVAPELLNQDKENENNHG